MNSMFLWPGVITQKKRVITANVDDKLMMRIIKVFYILWIVIRSVGGKSLTVNIMLLYQNCSWMEMEKILVLKD